MDGAGGSVPAWRSLSSQQLRETSAKFHCPPGAQTVNIADTLEDLGYADLQAVQLSGNRSCIVTFLSIDSAEKLVSEGMMFMVNVTHVLQPTLQLHAAPIITTPGRRHTSCLSTSALPKQQ